MSRFDNLAPADAVAVTADERRALKMLSGAAHQGPHGALTHALCSILARLESGDLAGLSQVVDDYRLQVAMRAAMDAAKSKGGAA